MLTQTLIRRAAWGGGLLRTAAFMLALGSACAPTHAAEMTVKIDNFAFTPAEITIAAGTTVVWTNGDDIPHSIVSPAAGLHSKPMDTGESARFTFTTAGSFTYFCGLHPHMKGTIIVSPQ